MTRWWKRLKPLNTLLRVDSAVFPITDAALVPMAAAAAAARPRGASAGVHRPSRVLQAMARGGLRGEAQPSLSIMLPYHRSPASEGEEPTMARRPDRLRPNFGQLQKIAW